LMTSRIMTLYIYLKLHFNIQISALRRASTMNFDPVQLSKITFGNIHY